MAVDYRQHYGPHRVRWPGLDGRTRMATFEHTELGMQRLHWRECAEAIVASGKVPGLTVEHVLENWEKCPLWAPSLPSSPWEGILGLFRR